MRDGIDRSIRLLKGLLVERRNYFVAFSFLLVAAILMAAWLVRHEVSGVVDRYSPGQNFECRALPESGKIKSSGCYRLDRDLNSTDAKTAITVEASDVVIDLAGHEITAPASSDPKSVAITGARLKNVVVENGRISGFHTAIWLSGTMLSVRDVSIRGAGGRGVALLKGPNNSLINSTIIDIGVAGVIPKSGPVHVHGLIISGNSAVIIGNAFRNIRGNSSERASEGIAIAASGYVLNALITDNTVMWDRLCSTPGSLTSSTFAVWIGGDGMGSARVERNRVTNAVNGVVADFFVEASLAANTFTNVLDPIVDRQAKSDAELAAAGIVDTRPNRHLRLGDNVCDGVTCKIEPEYIGFPVSKRSCAASG